MDYQYLTPEDYETAEKNGISQVRAYQRVHMYGWLKERAITEPVVSPKYGWSKYKGISLVSANTFYDRIKNKGMTPEEAALTPPTPRGIRFRPERRLRPEIIELAEKNGIKFKTLRHRVYVYKWSQEDAATIPVGTKRPNRRKKGWR